MWPLTPIVLSLYLQKNHTRYNKRDNFALPSILSGLAVTIIFTLKHVPWIYFSWLRRPYAGDNNIKNVPQFYCLLLPDTIIIGIEVSWGLSLITFPAEHHIRCHYLSVQFPLSFPTIHFGTNKRAVRLPIVGSLRGGLAFFGYQSALPRAAGLCRLFSWSEC